MKIIAALLLVSCFAFGQDKTAESAVEAAACGPREVEFEVNIDESVHPTPAPETGKAVIYVVQESSSFTRIGINGKWVGALKGKRTYLSASVEPGEHHLCAMGRAGGWSGVSLHSLKAEAGMTYYFVVFLFGGFGVETYDYSLRPADADEGRYLLAGARLSTSHPK